jgi:predicted AAA+ superfamily ATPase
MAMSNRDRIDRGMQVLADGLAPFVDSVMSASAPAGRDWVELLEARENAQRGTSPRYSRGDARFLLKVLTEEWRPFRDKLSRAEQSFASELRDAGNRWGHSEPFSGDDTYRALDTMERLLTAVGATAEADDVRKLRRDAQQATFQAETRRALHAVTGVDGHGLKPWREVIVPHEDVRNGNLRGAEFAADLHYVSLGDGSPEYVNSVEFFRRTYLTEGLKDLLRWTVRRIGGDRNAPPVVNLQTNFGGGKTHSMLALWHLLSGTALTLYPDELQKLLAGFDTSALPSARRVALVGNHIAAGKGSVKCEGTPHETRVRTLWGELAWQLGFARGGDAEARRAYAIVADADTTRSNPGAALGFLIREYAPCLILIDEWVAYARQLFGRDDLDGGTFDTQFTFAQTLTEAVKAVPGAMLVVSIPASSDVPSEEEVERGATDIEVGGMNGREALARLQQVIRRIADQWRPATPNESFAIVRQRLFETPGADALADIAAVARVFTDFYARNRGEFPNGVAEPSYEERIQAAYPVHPELFDRLYQDWSTLDRFQRTRGVLRLMSAVIQTLWENDDPAPLIMPGGVPLDSDLVLNEITQYLEDHFKPVIDTDIDGASATPAAIDAARPTFGQRRITRRIARAIFLGSAPTLKAAHKGIEQQHIWLGVATPGDTVGNFGSALHMLSDQATYLYNDGARYWYATQASVTRLAREHADRLRERPDETWEEILRRLRSREASTRGMFARVQIGPETSAEVADEPFVRLVVIHPQYRHSRSDETSAARTFADKAMLNRGTAQRMHRNMIVFLAPDAKRYGELDQAARDFLAWHSIASSDARIQELDLSAQQAAQAKKKLKDADETVNLRIAVAYQWLLVPVQRAGRSVSLDEMKTDTAKERLAERASDKLHNADLLRTVQGARNIRLDLDTHLSSVWAEGHIAVGKLWEYYCQYVYLPRLAQRSVLNDGILGVFSELAWDFDGFAVASGYDSSSGRYAGLAIPQEDVPPQITDLTLLVHPDRAKDQRDAERAEQAGRADRAGQEAARGRHGDLAGGTDGDLGGTDIGDGAGTLAPPPPPPPPEPKNTRFYGTARLDPERYVRDFNRLYQEVIQHLAAPEGVDLEITVEISARKKDGYPDDKARIVTENARTLKFDQYGFEDR